MYKYVVWGGTNGFVSILIRMFSFHCVLIPENDLFFKTIFHEFFHDFTQMECEYNIELYEKELMMTEKFGLIVYSKVSALRQGIQARSPVSGYKPDGLTGHY